MVLRTFKIGSELYKEFKGKVRLIKLTGGKSLSVGQVLRAMIRMYLSGKITNQDIIYTIYVNEVKGSE